MVKRLAPPLLPVGGTLALAFFLWFATFYLTWGSFWIKITFSAALLAAVSLWLQPKRSKQFRITPLAIVIGLLSAVVLYLIFWLGKQVSEAIFPFADHQIGGIYDMGEGTSIWLIASLLLFVTGPAEEIFWRGYLQENLMQRFGPTPGWMLASAAYAIVHIWSFNFMLTGAAAVAGLFWGGLYRYSGNLMPVIISHAVWSSVIFAFLPIH